MTPENHDFYISLEDDLIRIFGGDGFKRTMERFGMEEDEIIESKFVSKTIERAQEKVEKHNFEIRKHLLEYDDVLNQQRIVVYDYRRDALKGEQQIYELIRDFIIKIIQDLVEHEASKRELTPHQADKIYELLEQLSGLTLEEFKQAKIDESNSDSFKKDLINFVLSRYELYRKQQEQDIIKQAEKWLVLETIDQGWKQHMLNLDHLKEGINFT